MADAGTEGAGDVDVVVRDCGPRDGLQALDPVPPARRAELAAALAAAGLPEVEVGAFVSPRAVPAMAGAGEVLAALPEGAATRWWVLVPNARGAELALPHGVRRLTLTVSASPGYSEKNVGMTVDESLAQVGAVAAVARDRVGAVGPGGAELDVVVSCCFGSPFGDVTSVAEVASVVERARAGGATRITLADTTGTATPRRVREVLVATGVDVGLHLHDTRGTALANALAGLEAGVRRFDTSVGGLGGSPFAPGAGGNLPTEQLVLVLDDLGVRTGVDLDGVLAAARLAADLAGFDLPSRVAAAGPIPPFE